MPKKPGFPAYFQHFQPKMNFLQNLASILFWTLPFYILCQKSGKNNEPISRKVGNEQTDRQHEHQLIYRTSEVGPKIGLGYILGIANTHLCAKNRIKLMMKSRENAKKPGFPAYFRHFRPEKNISEIGIGHILSNANTLVEKIRKKSDENLQKRRFQAYFRHFRPEKNFSQKSEWVMF